jgi:hypothetical protein
MPPILDIFEPLLQDPQYFRVIDEFIKQSATLNIDFAALPFCDRFDEEDPVFTASEWHRVLYENTHVRVLTGDVFPDETVRAHRHAYKHVLVIIYGARFRSVSDKTIEIGEWPPGSYLLEADQEAFSSTNLSDRLYRGLVFEIKE